MKVNVVLTCAGSGSRFSHAQNKLSTLVGQDLGMKTIVDKMKSTGDLYIDVIENVHCVLDCNVPFPFLSPPL